MSEESHGTPKNSAKRSRIKPTVRKNADTANSKHSSFRKLPDLADMYGLISDTTSDFIWSRKMLLPKTG